VRGVKRAAVQWDESEEEESEEEESEEEEEFESAPSIHQLSCYEDLERATLQALQKAQGERTSKLERRAARLKSMIDELHADMHVGIQRKKK
jgi:hypothetical protein